MNSYKKRILKSEEIRLVPGAVIKRERQEEPLNVSGIPERIPESRPQVEEAYARGMAEGKALGRKEVERELAKTLKALKEALSEVSRLRSEILKGAEREVVTLAMAIAEKIVHQELTVDKGVVRAIFRLALDALGEKEKLIVHCNPGDLEILKSYLGDLKASQSGMGEVEFVSDPAMLAGGVRIEGAYGEVDASLEARMAMIRKVLFS